MKLCCNVIFLIAFFITVYDSVNAQDFKEVKIGNQVWTTQNLSVSKFRNGDVIPLAKTGEEWEAAGLSEKPAWCYYESSAKNGTKYGKLYNWYAVHDARGLAPTGYHIPSDAEWAVLVDYLGGNKTAGIKMKCATGWESFLGEKTCKTCTGWNDEYRAGHSCKICKDTKKVKGLISGNGTNSSRFFGLPGGIRFDSYGVFNLVGSDGFWWSSTEQDNSSSWLIHLTIEDNCVSRQAYSFKWGLSVRCIKD